MRETVIFIHYVNLSFHLIRKVKDLYLLLMISLLWFHRCNTLIVFFIYQKLSSYHITRHQSFVFCSLWENEWLWVIHFWPKSLTLTYFLNWILHLLPDSESIQCIHPHIIDHFIFSTVVACCINQHYRWCYPASPFHYCTPTNINTPSPSSPASYPTQQQSWQAGKTSTN